MRRLLAEHRAGRFDLQGLVSSLAALLFGAGLDERRRDAIREAWASLDDAVAAKDRARTARALDELERAVDGAIAAGRESPRDRLRRIVSELAAGRMDARNFCEQFELTYDIELDPSTLTPNEADAFARLFDEVRWYSPFLEERASIPDFKDELDIARAAAEAARLIDEA